MRDGHWSKSSRGSPSALSFKCTTSTRRSQSTEPDHKTIRDLPLFSSHYAPTDVSNKQQQQLHEKSGQFSRALRQEVYHTTNNIQEGWNVVGQHQRFLRMAKGIGVKVQRRGSGSPRNTAGGPPIGLLAYQNVSGPCPIFVTRDGHESIRWHRWNRLFPTRRAVSPILIISRTQRPSGALCVTWTGETRLFSPPITQTKNKALGAVASPTEMSHRNRQLSYQKLYVYINMRCDTLRSSHNITVQM